MSKLLNLFESVDVAPTLLISPEDEIFCEKTQKEFETLTGQLIAYKEGIAVLEAKLPALNPAVVDERHDYVDINYLECESWIDTIAFTPAYSYLYIRKAFERARTTFISQLVTYFNSKYNLDFKWNDHSKNAPPSWNDVVNQIVSHAGGSLIEAGTHKLLEDFKRLFVHRDEVPVAKGNTVTFNYVWLLRNYGKYMDMSEPVVKVLLTALGYFETGVVSIPDYIKSSFPTGYDDKMDMSTFREANSLCEKFKGFKYFQNRRLDLKFQDSQTAQEFVRLFF